MGPEATPANPLRSSLSNLMRISLGTDPSCMGEDERRLKLLGCKLSLKVIKR